MQKNKKNQILDPEISNLMVAKLSNKQILYHLRFYIDVRNEK